MQSQPKILFIVPFTNHEARAFTESLAGGMRDWNVSVKDSRLTTILFETKKFDVVHFFLPHGNRPYGARRSSGGTVFQTLLTVPPEPEDYKKSIFADNVITFSERESEVIRGLYREVKTAAIPPCATPGATHTLEPSSVIRERYGVEDRLFAVALNDFSDQEQFATFLYTAREYQRRGGFRFVVPLYRTDRRSLLWRERLQNGILQENLTATTLLDREIDVHSLIDAADLTLSMDKRPSPTFAFPLLAVEALCSGKPVISYNTSPIGELMSGFDNSGVAKAYEDFSRISRDLSKRKNDFEQISTDLARYARSRMSVEAVAAQHIDLYKSALKL